jgi:hypothetical protein
MKRSSVWGIAASRAATSRRCFSLCTPRNTMTCLAKRLRRFAMVSAVRAAARDDLKAHRRQMVAFIDNEMPIIAYDIVDLSFGSESVRHQPDPLVCDDHRLSRLSHRAAGLRTL